MRQLIPLIALLVFIGIIVSAGCTTTGPTQGASQTTGGASQITVIATTASSVKSTTASSGRIILDERITLMSGYPTQYQKYAFEEYGYQYLYPGDTFKVSINSDKPVNVVVVDKGDEMKFPQVIPEWNTVLRKDQWDYSPVVPAFSQSNVVRKDMTFTIKDKSSYFLIIDPRFSSEQTWEGSRHEDVHVDVKVTKL